MSSKGYNVKVHYDSLKDFITVREAANFLGIPLGTFAAKGLLQLANGIIYKKVDIKDEQSSTNGESTDADSQGGAQEVPGGEGSVPPPLLGDGDRAES